MAINVNLFCQLLTLLPKNIFSSLVKKHQSDKHTKGIDSWTHFVSMLFCHIGQANSVRDISNGLMSTTGNINHLGVGRAPSKSTISYVNANRDWRLFRDFYYAVLEHITATHSFPRQHLRRLKRKIYLMDASILPLCLSMFDWAKYRTNKGAGKLHAVLDYDGCLPVYACVTDGKTHEVNIARNLLFPVGSVVVFDRGYIDYEWMNNLDSRKVFFVTRAKDNMAYRVIEDFKTEGLEPDCILEDKDIELILPVAKQLYPGKLRLVRFLDSKTGKEYTFLSNNRKWSAKTVADIYKERWHIEVFFKHVKQNLSIKSFVGTSENAVQIQIWTAMIAILLLKFLQLKAHYKWNLSNLITFIRLNLFVKIPLFDWLNKPFYETDVGTNQLQLTINL